MAHEGPRDPRLVDIVVGMVSQRGHDVAENAAQGGEWTDGGGGRIADQARFYQYGQRGEFPPEWESYLSEAEKQLRIRELREKDPGYADYVRIKSLIEKS